MRKKIVTLCGFLGSGKTTLLRQLINQYSGHKLGILLNDFGEIPVDGTLIENADATSEAVLEIGGGSIFCACLKDSFVKALLELSKTPAEYIFIEASGMADPAGIQRLLEFAQLDSEFEHLCTLCAFDPIKSLKLSQGLEVIPRQVKASDVVILTKGDITTDAEKEKAKQYVESVKPTVCITDSIPDLKSVEVVENGNTFIHLGSFNTPDNRPECFAIDEIKVSLADFLEHVTKSEAILRVKGYVRSGSDGYFLSDTGRGFEVKECTNLPTPLTIICMMGSLEHVKHDLMSNGII